MIQCRRRRPVFDLIKDTFEIKWHFVIFSFCDLISLPTLCMNEQYAQSQKSLKCDTASASGPR